MPTALNDDEKARLRDGCYDLLLILTQEDDAAEGLKILDRAIHLRPQATAAYHLRRADCLGRSGDISGRDRETRAAEQTGPETALDYLLNGRELAFRGRFDEAITSLNMALQRDLDQTSAHLLLADLLPQQGTQTPERRQDQPGRLHQDQSGHGGALPVARLDLSGKKEARPGAPKPRPHSMPPKKTTVTP